MSRARRIAHPMNEVSVLWPFAKYQKAGQLPGLEFCICALTRRRLCCTTTLAIGPIETADQDSRTLDVQVPMEDCQATRLTPMVLVNGPLPTRARQNPVGAPRSARENSIWVGMIVYPQSHLQFRARSRPPSRPRIYQTLLIRSCRVPVGCIRNCRKRGGIGQWKQITHNPLEKRRQLSVGIIFLEFEVGRYHLLILAAERGLSR